MKKCRIAKILQQPLSASSYIRRQAGWRRLTWLMTASLVLNCSPADSEPAERAQPEVRPEAANGDAGQDTAPKAPTVPPEILPRVPVWTGDYEEMVERRRIRALVVYNKTQFFLDGGQPRGIAYEALTEFEKSINQKLGTRHLRVEVVVVPVRRDELLPALAQGRGDLAVANLTVTAARREIVDFSDPLMTGVRQIVVTGPSATPLSSIDDLAGREVHTRRSSSYYESLVRLNESLRRAGKPEVEINVVSDFLEDEDLLEMVNAGLIPLTVVDSHKAEFWAQIYPNIKLHPDLAVSSGDTIAWALRKETPELKAVVDEFVIKHRQGTLLGNIMLKRYLRNTKWVEAARSDAGTARLGEMAGHFRKYSERFGFDWLLLAAQGYQESRLDQSVRSPAGAIGVMQLLPSTAADPNVGIPNIDELENNIHAGAKYLAFIRDRYFADEAIDSLNQHLLSLAAYNAGPARVAQLRRESQSEGLDPNVWFQNVELIAARRIGRETVRYVANIFKYYIAYSQVEDRLSAGEG